MSKDNPLVPPSDPSPRVRPSILAPSAAGQPQVIPPTLQTPAMQAVVRDKQAIDKEADAAKHRLSRLQAFRERMTRVSVTDADVQEYVSDLFTGQPVRKTYLIGKRAQVTFRSVSQAEIETVNAQLEFAARSYTRQDYTNRLLAATYLENLQILTASESRYNMHFPAETESSKMAQALADRLTQLDALPHPIYQTLIRRLGEFTEFLAVITSDEAYDLF